MSTHPCGPRGRPVHPRINTGTTTAAVQCNASVPHVYKDKQGLARGDVQFSRGTMIMQILHVEAGCPPSVKQRNHPTSRSQLCRSCSTTQRVQDTMRTICRARYVTEATHSKTTCRLDQTAIATYNKAQTYSPLHDNRNALEKTLQQGARRLGI